MKGDGSISLYSRALQAFREANAIIEYFCLDAPNQLQYHLMNRYLRAILLTTIFIIPTGLLHAQSARSFYKATKQAHKQSHDSLAIVSITKAIELKSDKTSWILLRAQLYTSRKQYKAALGDYLKLTEIKTANTSYKYKAAETAFLIQDYTTATKQYSDIAKISHYDMNAWNQGALSEIYMKKFSDAVATCNKAIEINGSITDYRSYLYRAVAQDSLGQYTTARLSYIQAMHFVGLLKENKDGAKPQYKEYYVDLAKVDARLNIYQEALDNYAEAFKIDPDNIVSPFNDYVHYLRSQTYFSIDSLTLASNDLNNSIEKNDTFPDAFFARGLIFIKWSQFQNGISDFTKAIILNPKYYEAYAKRAYCYAQLVQYDNAMADYEKSLAIHRDTAVAVEYKAIKSKAFESKRTYDPPVVKINYPEFDTQKNEFIIPYDKKETYLDFNVTDRSKIESIYVNGTEIAFNKEDLNPRMDQLISIENKNAIDIQVTDIYKNKVQFSANIERINPFAKDVPSVEMKGKIVLDNTQQLPVKFARVIISDKSGNVVATIITTEAGTFEFSNLKPDQNYIVSIETEDPAFSSAATFQLLNESGKMVMKVPRKEGKFKFEILPYDPIALQLMTVEDFNILLELHGKIFIGNNQPLVNTRVKILDDKGQVVATAITNELGVFIFKGISPDKADFSKIIEVDTNGLKLPVGIKVFLADENGVVHSMVIYDKKHAFEFKMLEPDRVVMTQIQAIDPWLKAIKLSASKPDITIIENIYYPLNEYKVSDSAAKVLDRAVDLLKRNTHLRIELSSHTDSRGSEEFNLTLSDKRAQAAVQYMVSKGISADRVTGKGYGDQHLLNKCEKNVNCTEEEHQVNRRTEFKIVYQ